VDVAELLIEHGAAVNGVNHQKVFFEHFKHRCTLRRRAGTRVCANCCWRRGLS
jgi:hypothetical protein